MNTAFFWVNEEGKHQSKTPPTWVPSGRLTCAIGGGEIQGSVTSVPGSHQFGEQQFVCGPCVASAKSFAGEPTVLQITDLFRVDVERLL
jgi:hypothetical protein